MSIFKTIGQFFGFIPAGINLFDVSWTLTEWHGEDVLEQHNCMLTYARGRPGEMLYIKADKPGEED